MEEISNKTVVRNIRSAEIGVVCDDMPGMMSLCEDGQVMVVYDGASYGMATDMGELEIMGPENAQADLVKCGAGKEAECCIFLVVGAKGAECVRFGSFRYSLIFRKMVAKRNPTELYPDCQKF